MPTLTIRHDETAAQEIAALCQEATVDGSAPGVTVAVFDTLDQLQPVAAVIATAAGRTVTSLAVEP
jgi:CRISPR/Cas system-associated exonuclease Cas4 (RecB family)